MEYQKSDGKRCTKCQEVKSIDEFTLAPNNSDGISHNCRLCTIKEDKLIASLTL